MARVAVWTLIVRAELVTVRRAGIGPAHFQSDMTAGNRPLYLNARTIEQPPDLKRTKFSSMKFTSSQFRYNVLAPIICGAKSLDE